MTAVEILGIVPARAGSKGVPGKNIRPIAGRPLISYSIEAGVKSHLITRMIVSTDSEEIGAVSAQFGAEVPFLRPAALATDDAPTYDVIRHALEHLQADGYKPDLVVILQPTSPLRLTQHIDEALDHLEESNADSLTSVCMAEHSPYWMRTISESGHLQPFVDRSNYSRRQALPPVYRLNGAIYVTSPRVIEKGALLGERVLPYVMDPEHSVDIDSELDLAFAELLILRQQRSSVG
ncbi:MAG: acylneuraminate cytidylyltransferase family protein [Symbiobacteriia bacterium]